MDYERIRFVTAYYSRLMGLKAVPIGLTLLVAAGWLNAQTGRTRDLAPLFLWTAVGAAAYLLIDRYYRRTFGRVEPIGRSAVTDGILVLVLSAATIGALRADDGTARALMAGGSARFPISMYALLFGFMFLLDYVRTCRRAGLTSLAVFPGGLACVGGILLSSFLPILGNDFSEAFGFRSVLFLVYAADGLIILLCGVAEHAFLVRSMTSAGKVTRGQSV